MANKYETILAGSLSTRQLSRLYWQLLDTVKRGSDEEKMLDEAFRKADFEAFIRETKQKKEDEIAHSTDTMACILCTR